MENVYKFNVEISGDVPSFEAFPIYEDYTNTVIGAFTLHYGNVIRCFISGIGNPVGLKVSSGGAFYFTPKEGKDGKVSYAIASEIPLSIVSVLVRGFYGNSK